VTNNIERRLLEHSTAYNPESYTAQRLPVELIYSENIFGPRSAIKREKQIKKWSYKKKMALVNNEIGMLRKLSKKKNFKR
jgi:putative endonuclease